MNLSEDDSNSEKGRKEEKKNRQVDKYNDNECTIESPEGSIREDSHEENLTIRLLRINTNLI